MRWLRLIIVTGILVAMIPGAGLSAADRAFEPAPGIVPIRPHQLASLPVYEPFDYPAETGLGGQGDWVNVNSGDSVTVTAGSLVYPNLASSTGNRVRFDGAGIDPHLVLATPPTTTVYFSFLVQVSSLGSLNTTGGYFAGVGQNSTTFGATVWARRDAGGAGYNIGINPRSTGANTVYSATVFTTTDVLFIVGAYELVAGTTNDAVRLWINPPSLSFESLTAPTSDFTVTNTGTDLTSIDRFFLRQDSSTTTPLLEVDELRIGQSWASITPDAFPEVQFTSSSFSVSESSVAAVVTATLSAAAGFPITVTLVTSDGTALSLNDYAGGMSSIVFPAGTTSITASIPITNDLLVEGSEAFSVTITEVLSGDLGSNLVTLVTILDDDSPPTVQLTSATYPIRESASAVVTATLSFPAPITASVILSTADGTASSFSDYHSLAVTVTFPIGSALVTATIPITDDTLFEPAETFVVWLSTPVSATIGSPISATVTILDDDIRIRHVQGLAHLGPLSGTTVNGLPGIVTARRSNGFYFQDPTPDADIGTSEAIFAFTSSAPTVAIGDSVIVSGAASEFRPGGAAENLTISQIGRSGSPATVSVLSSGNPLPTPIVIGSGGRTPPTEVIDDDAIVDVETSGSFDSATDGIDFFESLEAMLIQVSNAVVVGPSNNFGEVVVLASDGAGTRTTRGGIVIRPSDFNPERIILDDEILKLLSLTMPSLKVGDMLSGPITGVVDYSFGNFKVQLLAPPAVVSGTLVPEVTSAPSNHQLSIASFNVENLDPSDPITKFTRMADAIVNNLLAPDLIALQEVQDNDGPVNSAVTDAAMTAAQLIAAIQAAGGPVYQYRDIAPVDDQDGGEPGGNIRVAFLFRADRGLDFVDRPGGSANGGITVVSTSAGPILSASPGRIDPLNAAFLASRKPLAAEFLFNGHRLFVVNNHFRSKGGDTPLFGRFQPPQLESEPDRIVQALIVHDFVESILKIDPAAKVVVLGDLNDFEFSPPLAVLRGSILHNLADSLPLSERYDYLFDGNSQTLDHILVSTNLSTTAAPEYDIVHLNSEYPAAERLSDHDPIVARLALPPPAIRFATGTMMVSESVASAVVTVTLDRAVVVTVTAIISTLAGSALPPGDYLTATQIITFAPGMTLTTLGLSIVGDTVTEPAETLTLVISSAVSATIGSPSALILTIVDDDPGPTSTPIPSPTPTGTPAAIPTSTPSPPIGTVLRRVFLPIATSGAITGW